MQEELFASYKRIAYGGMLTTDLYEKNKNANQTLRKNYAVGTSNN